MFIFKNKGILVPFYLFTSLIAVALIVNVLRYLIGGMFLFEYDFSILAGIGFVAAGNWTFYTRDSYYVANGEKKRMYEENTFFFFIYGDLGLYLLGRWRNVIGWWYTCVMWMGRFCQGVPDYWISVGDCNLIVKISSTPIVPRT